MFQERYRSIFDGDEHWLALPDDKSILYDWKDTSTYLLEPPFFGEKSNGSGTQQPMDGIKDARILGIFGDSITTDHISPAGNIRINSLAGQYLRDLGVPSSQLNTYGARRGNHEVMMRGTFDNPRLKNQLVPDTEGAVTIFWPEKKKTSIYEAAMQYQDEGIPLILFAGKEYGTGSSRDWAAKGPALLGVKAVIARSFERIHRSNLVGMGILPLEFEEGTSTETLKLKGDEVINIPAVPSDYVSGDKMIISIEKQSGEVIEVPVIVRLDTKAEIESFQTGGILNRILLDMQNADQNM
jgi:aconitate hydratase